MVPVGILHHTTSPVKFIEASANIALCTNPAHCQVEGMQLEALYNITAKYCSPFLA